MKKIVYVLIALFLASTSLAQDLAKRLKGVDKELEQVLDTWQASGFAVAVVHKKKVIYSKGFGYRDYENKIPVDINTLFAIGSCTKAFTTSILGQLESEEKLDFDESPITYIPELSFYSKEMNSNITIKDMMSHRTGLPRHDYSWYLFPTNSKDSLMMRIQYQEPFKDVREQWYYNNFMYLTQGVISERITGKSWEENVQERIFDPLGMKQSNLDIAGMENSKNASLGYSVKNDTIEKMEYYDIAGMSPAGSINSNVNEMANWLITWVNGGEFKGEEVIPAPFVSQAMSSQMVIRASLPSKERPGLHLSNYGYAWSLSSY